MTTFSDLALIPELQRAIADAGYETPTPIQAEAIPPLLDGHDVLGCAQTGTGKTAAFALPVLQHIERGPRARGKRHIQALVLTPTRELASQIADSFRTYGRYLDIRGRVIFGGVSQRPQVAALKEGIDILVATPGRLLDLHGQGHVDLSQVDFFVLDEADRMLDMGFIHDIRKVLAVLPKRRQNLLFSATMPPDIVELAGGFLRDPIRVEVAPESTTVERIDQYIMYVQKSEKRRLLTALLEDPKQGIEQAIVFTRTKHGANRAAPAEGGPGGCGHPQQVPGARERRWAASMPERSRCSWRRTSRPADRCGRRDARLQLRPAIQAKGYVHRIGRTGRAGREGIAIAFCQEDDEQPTRSSASPAFR